MCVHPKRSHSKYRDDLIRMHLFLGYVIDENEFEALSEIRPLSLSRLNPDSENSPPLIMRPVGMLTGPLQTLSPVERRDRNKNGWSTRKKTTFLKPLTLC
ncbi:hypothetical protein TNCV_709631 [Trichonephila clavipes]|nr:hypothetical protein TNCV_709631 [Trichonephila clavipes]